MHWFLWGAEHRLVDRLRQTALVKDRREGICKIKMGKQCELLQGLVKGLPGVFK